MLENNNRSEKCAGKRFSTIDPRNGEVIARVAEGEKEDVDLAVKAAREAFDHGPWPRLPASVITFIIQYPIMNE